MQKKNYVYNATVTNVVDGDTIDVTIDLGFGVFVQHRVRLNGINTQETNDPNPALKESGLKAKQFVTTKLLNQKITIESFRSDKYRRYLADVYLGDELVNKTLMNEGLAVEYHGGKR